MKLNFDNVLHAAEYRILDCAGRQVPEVISYDTETREIAMKILLPDAVPTAYGGGEEDRYLLVPTRNGDSMPMLVRFVLPGSTAVDSKGGSF